MAAQNSATLLGFDYGKKIIGVAVGSTFSGLAEPLTTLQVTHGQPVWEELSRLIEQWHPGALILGLPLNMDDSDNDMTRAARKFGNRLKARYNLPVHMVDERLSSRVARDTLMEAGISPRQHKRHLDALAAQTILQSYLNELVRPGASTP